jgi:hypothetical protein
MFDNKKGSIAIFLTLCIILLCAATSPTGAASSSTYSPTNMVVDFYSTTLTSDLSPGESGVLNLVIKNTGDLEAENVEVWIPGNVRIDINKRRYIGLVNRANQRFCPRPLEWSRRQIQDLPEYRC